MTSQFKPILADSNAASLKIASYLSLEGVSWFRNPSVTLFKVIKSVPLSLCMVTFRTVYLPSTRVSQYVAFDVSLNYYRRNVNWPFVSVLRTRLVIGSMEWISDGIMSIQSTKSLRLIKPEEANKQDEL